MKIVIAGSGDTGTHLAKMLASEKQDVVLMSADGEYLDSIDSTYNLMTVRGNACLPADLRRAEVPGADLFVAVTPCGSDNMVACQLASMSGAASTVARVETDQYSAVGVQEVMRRAGISMMVYPEALVAEDIIGFVGRTSMAFRHEMHDGRLVFSAMKVTPSCRLAGRSLVELAFGDTLHVAAIRRNRQMIIPRGSDTLEAGDTVYVTYNICNEGRLSQLTGIVDSRVRNVMITGQGALLTMLLTRLEGRGLHVTVVSRDEETLRSVSEQFPWVTLSSAEATDIAALREEGLEHCDVFMALGPLASANIVGALVAKENGVRHTVAQIEDLQYMHEAESLGIDKIVNKKLITSGVILRSIMGRKLRVKSLLSLEDAEVAEVEVSRGARVTRRQVKDLDVPPSLTFGALVRGGEVGIVTGSTLMQEGDQVMVIFRPGTLDKVEKMFR